MRDCVLDCPWWVSIDKSEEADLFVFAKQLICDFVRRKATKRVAGEPIGPVRLNGAYRPEMIRSQILDG
jgi:hypothetical protein